MTSPLYPFLKVDGSALTSNDTVNIKNLGYAYGPCSLDQVSKEDFNFAVQEES